MAEIMRTQGRSERGFLAKLGNDLSDAAFSQRSQLPEKELPIWAAL